MPEEIALAAVLRQHRLGDEALLEERFEMSDETVLTVAVRRLLGLGKQQESAFTEPTPASD